MNDEADVRLDEASRSVDRPPGVRIDLGGLVSAGSVDRWMRRAQIVELHRWLSSAVLALTGVHALALTADRWVRFDLFDVLVPFVSACRPFAVGLGVIAAGIALAVHAAFELRREIGGRWWRRIHGLNLVLFALATAHGIAAGSDADHPGLRLLYLGASGVVVGIVLHRMAPAIGLRAS